LAGAAQGAIFNLSATLDGAQEVPPVATPATGSASAVVDDVLNTIVITGSYSGLIGSQPFGHLHGLAPVGANAGVILNLTVVGEPNGTFSGNGTLTPTQIAGVLNGDSYINIHSSFAPGGEIRGQLFVPEPGTASLLLGAGALVLRRRRR
ncbi:MAG TPA: CHRD domain-containing protein, partial [Tepidisphaeraceae bacterium]|nr:CHRD domain-containing protein [Tepidisphaeraceae bacterium]